MDADLNARTALKAAPFDGAQVSLPDDPRFKRNIQIAGIEADRFAKISLRIYWEQNGKEKFVETIAYARSGL